MMMIDRRAHMRQALRDRLLHLGEPALHTNCEGGTEWLWGHFRAPIDEASVKGYEIDLTNAQPMYTLTSPDALNVKAWKSRHSADVGAGSKLVIRGLEYKVLSVIPDDLQTRLMLGSDCKPVVIGLDPPRCYADICNNPAC